MFTRFALPLVALLFLIACSFSVNSAGAEACKKTDAIGTDFRTPGFGFDDFEFRYKVIRETALEAEPEIKVAAQEVLDSFLAQTTRNELTIRRHHDALNIFVEACRDAGHTVPSNLV